MHLPIIFVVALAFLIANAQSSPVERSSARHPPQVLEGPDSTRSQDADSVQALPYDEGFAVSGAVERDFNIVSPPPKVIPRSVEGFSMSGLLPPPRKIIKSRRGESITSAEGFNPVSPSPKTRPSAPRTSRRENVWTSFMHKLTRKSLAARQSGGLTPYEQNGPSTYGTSQMETLPSYYGSGTSVPWNNITTTNANPYKSCPNTGSVRYYDFTVAECNIRPDGIETKRAVCVNGQYPGPLLEANYGDTIQVRVTNNLKDEGTSMHWHGFLQTGTNHMDGVPGVTQCAIAPGASMTYTFRAELYGTAWYHTHYSGQYSGGAVGPIVIYGPTNKNADIDIGPVMLSDWYRNDYMTNIRGLLRPVSEGGPINPLVDSNLINGKMRFPCEKTNLDCKTADYSTFSFISGQNHLLRLVNTGSNAIQKVAIDGHTMQVISNDFMPIEPYNTSMVSLGVGQRADVIVYGSGKPTDKVWMRSNIVACSVNDGQLTEALAVIYYEQADTTQLPAEGFNLGPAAATGPQFCGNPPLTVTVPSFPLKASVPAVTRYLDIRMKSNGTHMLLNFADSSFRANFNDPVLSRALIGLNSNYEAQKNVWNVGGSKTMRAVITNYDAAPHPIYLHGHNMQTLNSGFGSADETTIIRPDNPQRRDVMIMPPGTDARPSYLVIQWDADNPGVWPLHCHFSWHSSLGLAINVLETPAAIAKSLGRAASGTIAPVCKAWNGFTKSTGPLISGIDSGM